MDTTMSEAKIYITNWLFLVLTEMEFVYITNDVPL
jgi:hypothetical protein